MNKREAIETELAHGPVFLYIDARRDGVALPSHLVGQFAVPVRIGYGLRPPIVDLTLDDAGISGTLSFGGRPHACVFPWSAIFAMRIGDAGQVAAWIADVPAEVELKPIETKPKRHLRSV